MCAHCDKATKVSIPDALCASSLPPILFLCYFRRWMCFCVLTASLKTYLLEGRCGVFEKQSKCKKKKTSLSRGGGTYFCSIAGPNTQPFLPGVLRSADKRFFLTGLDTRAVSWTQPWVGLVNVTFNSSTQLFLSRITPPEGQQFTLIVEE